MLDSFIIEADFITNGFRCLVVGFGLGHRCGYVELPPTHALANADEEKVTDSVDVHGGWTMVSDDWSFAVPPMTPGSTWIGFDCAHYGDGKDLELIERLNEDDEIIQEYAELIESGILGGEVRKLEYVAYELEKATKQLSNITKLGALFEDFDLDTRWEYVDGDDYWDDGKDEWYENQDDYDDNWGWDDDEDDDWNDDDDWY